MRMWSAGHRSCAEAVRFRRMKASIGRRLVLAWLCLFPALPSWAAGEIQLSINSRPIQAELALTEAERATGLMYRRSLCGNCGMLFVFPYAGQWSFWTKNTPLPLSLAFLDANGVVRQLVDMEPESTESHRAADEVVYALEMQQGWFARNGVKVGDNVAGLDRLPEN